MTSDVCDQKCTVPKKRLGGSVLIGAYPEKQEALLDLVDIIDTAAVPKNSNKTANNAKYSNCKRLNHETYDISLHLRSRPF